MFKIKLFEVKVLDEIELKIELRLLRLVIFFLKKSLENSHLSIFKAQLRLVVNKKAEFLYLFFFMYSYESRQIDKIL